MNKKISAIDFRAVKKLYACVLASLTLFPACVSNSTTLPASADSVPPAPGLAKSAGTDVAAAQVVKNYSFSGAMHAARLKEVRGEKKDAKEVSAPADLTNLKLPSSDPSTQAPSSGMPSSVQLLMRSERWLDVLTETTEQWNRCTETKIDFPESCREIGRVRALAHVRMGHSQQAWELYDVLAVRAVHSSDALFFAELHLEVGAPALCAQLATYGLQWSPSDVRLNLWALRAKCLRLSGQQEEARHVVRMGLAEFPGESALLLESAFVAFGENNLTRACDILERLFLQGTQQVAVFFNWGQCLVRRRDVESLAAVLSRARSEWPSERVWIILAGEVALLEGRLEDARQSGLDYLSAVDGNDIFRAQAERLSRAVSGEK